jgi:exosortase
METDVTLGTALKSRQTLPHIAFLCICLLIAAIGWPALHAWLEASKSSQQSSDFWTIPLISLYFCYERRDVIFAKAKFAPFGFFLLALGIGIYAATLIASQAHGLPISVVPAILGVIVCIAGAFLACYGTDAWRAAIFPLGFLLFAVPLPQAILEPLVRWLQNGSAAVVGLLFGLLRVPFQRNGLIFDLTGLRFHIAPECSGIRSSYALMVLTVLISYWTLRSAWRRLLMVASVVPLVLVKNGIRIVTISLLTAYVDPSIIDGPLHHQGGFVFFGLVLVAEGGLCWLLRRSELKAISGEAPASRSLSFHK